MITNDKDLIIRYNLQSLNAPAGFVTIINNGGYVAFFTLSFEFELKIHENRSPNISYKKFFKLLYPSTARNLKLSSYCYNVIGDTKLISKISSYMPFNRCFSLGGTIFDPTFSEAQCPVDNSIPPEISPQTTCSCCCCCFL
ncbi:hypothetical protein Z959_10465 [Clostridium novyi B str. ATCC 27606]|uniref:Uncharacterized protein n=2 Tax=Clostridium TaxID=1485 RepID=A0AA40IU73_CLONO|nr:MULTISPECIES: hypothetical protein [Clostridium]KEI13889.1 hypothetical protein Z958_01315 [Clostridium novyi B str. NCTC 9691]KEI16296.1 hypothetical protein Z959_10465 [Clostridium novyi B str. ATCC 27606]KEI18046.1 hypothetical protein Z960_04340 [Clostridium haemolyticum NCTC 9693]KGN02753.1 hypothetical protein Z961_07885 [Clostridium haemolyticum NCTC 8350]CAG7840472.1 hypothetical protein CLOHAE12215_01896 [Clostridium haemolyticum]